MFVIFNKEKIYAYLVSIVTVVLLFCVASSLNTNSSNTVATSSESNSKLLPIYNVEIQEKKVAFTMNCAW